MKYITAILLSLILLFCCMGKTGIVISYQINKTYFAKVLCENKLKPEAQCNGKCQLKKQLSATENKKEKQPESVDNLPEVYWIVQQEIKNKNQNFLPIKKSAQKNDFLIADYSVSIFHPPGIL